LNQKPQQVDQSIKRLWL